MSDLSNCSVSDGVTSCENPSWAKGLCSAHYFRLRRTGAVGSVQIRSTADLRECGTVAAFVRHKRHGEEPCEPCTKANRAEAAARQRVFVRLAQENLGRYRELLEQERLVAVEGSQP